MDYDIVKESKERYDFEVALKSEIDVLNAKIEELRDTIKFLAKSIDVMRRG